MGLLNIITEARKPHYDVRLEHSTQIEKFEQRRKGKR